MGSFVPFPLGMCKRTPRQQWAHNNIPNLCIDIVKTLTLAWKHSPSCVCWNILVWHWSRTRHRHRSGSFRIESLCRRNPCGKINKRTSDNKSRLRNYSWDLSNKLVVNSEKGNVSDCRIVCYSDWHLNNKKVYYTGHRLQIIIWITNSS